MHVVMRFSLFGFNIVPQELEFAKYLRDAIIYLICTTLGASSSSSAVATRAYIGYSRALDMYDGWIVGGAPCLHTTYTSI